MNPAYERLLDTVHALAADYAGPGANVSVDPDPAVGSGFVARAWNRMGYVVKTDEIGRPNKAAAVRALARSLAGKK